MDEVSGNEHSIHWRLSQLKSLLKGARHRCSKSRLPIQPRSLTARRGSRREGAGSPGHEWPTESPGTQSSWQRIPSHPASQGPQNLRTKSTPPAQISSPTLEKKTRVAMPRISSGPEEGTWEFPQWTQRGLKGKPEITFGPAPLPTACPRAPTQDSESLFSERSQVTWRRL